MPVPFPTKMKPMTIAFWLKIDFKASYHFAAQNRTPICENYVFVKGGFIGNCENFDFVKIPICGNFDFVKI